MVGKWIECILQVHMWWFLYTSLSHPHRYFLSFSLSLEHQRRLDVQTQKKGFNMDYVPTENRILVWRFFVTDSQFFPHIVFSPYVSFLCISIGFHLVLRYTCVSFMFNLYDLKYICLRKNFTEMLMMLRILSPRSTIHFMQF